MGIRMRDYHWTKDFETVRRFLTDIFHIRNAYTNWISSQLENLKFGPGGTEYLDEEDEYLKIWETLSEAQQNALRIMQYLTQGPLEIVSSLFTLTIYLLQEGSCYGCRIE